jgi:hypothetical protein
MLGVTLKQVVQSYHYLEECAETHLGEEYIGNYSRYIY